MPTKPWPFHGVILAGGLSSRMGQDKAQLPIDGQLLLERLSCLLLELTSSVTVAAGTPERAELYRKRLGELSKGIRFVSDEYPGDGPLAGLHAGLSGLPEGYAFVMACDMPQVSEVLLALFAAESVRGEDSWDIIHVEGQPFHALYHTRVAASIQVALENRDFRVMSLLSKARTRTIQGVDPNTRGTLINLNTPEDYLNYISRREGGKSDL